jgi:hypothetical protein
MNKPFVSYRYPNIRKNPNPKDWREDIKEFDILISPSGDLRVVREVKFKPNGYLFCVTFTKRLCNKFAWGLTYKFRTDLRNFRKAGVKYRPKDADFDLQAYLTSDPTDYRNPKYNCITVKSFA